jgi:hypothetical protein
MSDSVNEAFAAGALVDRGAACPRLRCQDRRRRKLLNVVATAGKASYKLKNTPPARGSCGRGALNQKCDVGARHGLKHITRIPESENTGARLASVLTDYPFDTRPESERRVSRVEAVSLPGLHETIYQGPRHDAETLGR